MTDPAIVATVLGISHVVLGFIATVYVSANRQPSAAIAWVLTIVFIPLLGALAFLLVGVGRLPRARREAQRRFNERALERPQALAAVERRDEWPPWLASAVALNTRLGALPMTAGNRGVLLGDYDDSLRRMVHRIDAARTTIHVEFYILVLDHATEPLFEALARATARGVVVRVLFDHVAGLLLPRHRPTQAALTAMGAQWHPMLPLRPLRRQWQRPDMRNHRKLLIVDGDVAFTGSQNVIDASYLKKRNVARGLRWKELMVALEGPAVDELAAVFASDWYSETGEVLVPAPAGTTAGAMLGATAPAAPGGLLLGAEGGWGDATADVQIVPSGPTFENANNLKLYVHMIQNATRRVSITSPYFVPDESLMLAIVTAAARGVRVDLFVSAIGDQPLVHHAQRSYYEALLRAGVTVWLYRAPHVLHSKHFSIDDDVAVVGSSNMDIRSFALNLEVSVLIRDPHLVSELDAIEDGYRRNSDRLLLEEWLKRPAGHKVMDNLARLTSSLQ
ncbi:phospholipase D-like domain-containing protein [Arthrobacter agilis]|uniref:phospholipase D-like domain-containing protein n=1 Tax=Arthrobacter agilis TaxID=37921 RepID=UPI00278AEB45|nr:phospholipase D-like domain-containing protein [Arthrobacter agilis]MDQ0734898.1 cardiolipin synthase [Arthrobacter agilis]